MKQVGKRLLSLLLALCMMMSLCVSALAVNDVTVTATLDTPTLYRKSVAQTVKLRVATSEPITICDYQVKLKLPEGWTVTAMENDDANAQLVPADYNLATGSVVWNGDGEDHSVTNFVIYTVEIPADTKAGRYELSLYEVEANATYGTKPVLTSPDNNTSATLTIKDDDTSNLYKDYCVAFYTGGGSGQSTLQMGTDKNVVSLEVLIQNGIINKGQTYNAYGITLSYDPTILEFVKVGNVDCIYSVENDKVNGTVTVYRSGTQLSCSARDGFFAEFKGIATGSCNVAITRAYVDKGENANVRNAPSANITTTGYIVNVDGPYYNVTASSPQELVYEPYAKANTAYTFTLANGYDWRGMAIRYTIDNGDGISWPVEYDTTKNCYTIPANWVTGDIHIDVSFRNFDVTVEGNAKNDVTLSSTSKPSYRVDYPFTLNKQEGWTYTVAVTVGGKNANYTVSEDGKTYTIAGKDIIGNIVITANKAKGDSQISFSGDTSDLEGEAIRNAPVGEDFTFTIKKDANYDYTVDAKYTESGKTIPVTEDPEGTYTIQCAESNTSIDLHIVSDEHGVEIYEDLSSNDYDAIDSERDDVSLPTGTVLFLSGNGTLYFHSSNAQVDALPTETAPNPLVSDAAYTLSDSEDSLYLLVGEDIEPGVYDVTCTAGTGYFSFVLPMENTRTMYCSAWLYGDPDYVDTLRHITLTEDTEVTLSNYSDMDFTITLTPSETVYVHE